MRDTIKQIGVLGVLKKLTEFATEQERSALLTRHNRAETEAWEKLKTRLQKLTQMTENFGWIK